MTGQRKERYPCEVFGYPLDALDPKRMQRRKYSCLFDGRPCSKKSRLIKYPMGVCCVRYGEETVALCPTRFLQDKTVFRDIAMHKFGGLSDLLVFSEVGLPGIGNFDYVMVKHRPLSCEVEDFVAIEFQTGQTTGTGSLVQGLKDCMAGKDIGGAHYEFGLNMADIWKRTFTQVLTKGVVMEHWGKQVYWVVQEPVYRNFTHRYNLGHIGYNGTHSTVFAIYDIKPAEDRYELYSTRIESATIDGLFAAFRNNPHIPALGAFVKKLEKAVSDPRKIKLLFE